MPNVLVVYYFTRPYPPRESIRDHLYSFERYAPGRCYYFNAALGSRPLWTRVIKFDLVVFHTTLLAVRWNRDRFRRLMSRLAWLGRLPAVKAVLPQDEFISTDLLAEFIDRFDVGHVFSPASDADRPLIYGQVRRPDVSHTHVLTGYLDEGMLARVDRLARTSDARSIDIGYRARSARAWLGRRGLLKSRVAEQFVERLATSGLALDISLAPEDTLLGDAWYDFLLKSKYTIGAEGGASLHDHDGSTRRRTEQFLAAHPDAQFDEIEAACFPDRDGNLALQALAPRHLEACATRTCQVLVAGAYDGVLEPGKHYIELQPDFANLDEVVAQLADDSLRRSIVEQAYQDIVASGRYTYRKFVELVLERSLGELELPSPLAGEGPGVRGRRSSDRLLAGRRLLQTAAHRAAHWRDRAGWRFVAAVGWALRQCDRRRKPRVSQVANSGAQGRHVAIEPCAAEPVAC